jgi:predicted phage-related endonuclease
MAKAYGDPYTDQVPDHVIVQVQHQMYVSGLSRVYVALAVPSYYAVDRRLYIVQRDDELIHTIIDFGVEWWKRHVLANQPPNGEGVPPLYVLKALERRAGAQIMLTDEAAAWASRRTELKGQIKSLTAEVETEDARLIHALADAEIGLLPDGRKVTYYSYESNRFDKKRFKLEHPELAPDYMKKSSYRTLYVKRK